MLQDPFERLLHPARVPISTVGELLFFSGCVGTDMLEPVIGDWVPDQHDVVAVLVY